MSIVEFKIGKGRTLRPSEAEEWTRKYLEITVKLTTEEEFHDALLRAEQIIDQWLAAPEVGSIPEIDLARVNRLVWTRYSDRSRAEKPDEAAWTFADPARHEDKAVVKALIEAIKASGGKLRVGNVEFSLSGKEKQFISRRPLS